MTASVEGHQNAATITVLMLMGYNLTHTSTQHTHTLYLKSIFTSEYATTGTGTGITVTLSSKSAKSAYVVLLCFCEKVNYLMYIVYRVGQNYNKLRILPNKCLQYQSTQKQPNCKKRCGPCKKGSMKKVVKSKVAAQKWLW